MANPINDSSHQHFIMERLKPALAASGLVCAASLYHWQRINTGTNYQPIALLMGGMALAAVEGIAIRTFSENKFWRERPHFLTAVTCILIEQPALWLTGATPLKITASIAKQIACHFLLGITEPLIREKLGKLLGITESAFKPKAAFAKMITQIGIAHYFAQSSANESLANIATIRQGFLIASSYYLPKLLGFSHRIPTVSPAPANPPSISLVKPGSSSATQKNETPSDAFQGTSSLSLLDSLPGNSAISTPSQNIELTSYFQEDEDSAVSVRVAKVPNKLAEKAATELVLQGPSDPYKDIADRLQAVVAEQANCGAPVDPNGSFAQAARLMGRMTERATNEDYLGKDGKRYFEPQWKGIGEVFQVTRPYEEKGQFINTSATLKTLMDGQMCTILSLQKSDEQKNYECTMHRLSKLPLLAPSYQYLNDMSSFIEYQNTVILELKAELEKHFDKWKVDRIEVEGTKEGMLKRGYSIDVATWATELYIFHKRTPE